MEAAKANLENKPELKREMFIDEVLNSLYASTLDCPPMPVP